MTSYQTPLPEKHGVKGTIILMKKGKAIQCLSAVIGGETDSFGTQTGNTLLKTCGQVLYFLLKMRISIGILKYFL